MTPGLRAPTFQDVLAARNRIRPYMAETPLYSWPALNAATGLDLLVKHENHLPTGAFKVRGGVNLLARMPPAERRAGVISASTGNHGQSIAYAARLFGVKAVIVVPGGNNPGKNDSMRALGAEVVEHGKDFDEAREHVEGLAHDKEYRYVHSANEPDLIAGVGTHTLEILERAPDVDTVIVPIGGGSGACGAGIVAKAMNPDIEVIGVQAEAAPAAYLSWKKGGPVDADSKTFAEGIATRVPFELTQSILRNVLDDFVLVSDDDLRRAVLLLLEKTRNLAEGAGAAATAAAVKLKRRLAGRRVAVILSGGNLSVPQLGEILAGAPAAARV